MYSLVAAAAVANSMTSIHYIKERSWQNLNLTSDSKL